MTVNGKIVKVGDFCTIKDSTMAEHGVKKGEVCYIAGDTIVHVTEKDPYALRRLFIVARVDPDGHILADQGGFMCDGKRLKPVSAKRQEELDAIHKEDFDEPAANTESPD